MSDSGHVLKPLHKHTPHRFSDLEWGLSVVFGAVGIFTIGLILLVLAISHIAVVRNAVVTVLPRDVQNWFEPAARSGTQARSQAIPAEVLELAKRIAAEPKAKTTSVPESFTNQSSKADVIRIHGVPTRVDGDVWYYGPSVIYFKNDRVTGWSSSREFPLRTR